MNRREMWPLKYLFAFGLLMCTFKTVASETIQRCSNDSIYCENGGICFENDQKMKFCSCIKDYYGDKCHKSNDNVFKKVVFGLGILCAIFLIVLIVLSWQLHSKICEYEDYKQKVKHEKREGQKKNNLKAPRSRQGSIRSNSSAGSKSNSATGKFLFDITATGIERSSSYQDEIQLPIINQNDVPDKAVPPSDFGVEQLSRMDEIPRIASIADDNVSVSSVSIGSNQALVPMMTQDVPGRAKSWAGPASEAQEDLNKIYDQYYRGKSDDENPVGNEVHIDGRGYIKKNPKPDVNLTPGGYLKVDNLRRFNQYSDSKGRPRSMTDLRLLAMNGEPPKKSRSETNLNMHQFKHPVKVRSVENIHTGKMTVLTSHPKHHPRQNRKPKGIWANEQDRRSECSF